jgi:P4 family phage/plasmid primase-like protien
VNVDTTTQPAEQHRSGAARIAAEEAADAYLVECAARVELGLQIPTKQFLSEMLAHLVVLRVDPEWAFARVAWSFREDYSKADVYCALERLDPRPFERGDHVEIADRLLLEDTGTPRQDLVHSEGSFWRYDDARGIWTCENVEKDLCSRVQSWAGLRVGEKKALRINKHDVEGALWVAQSKVEDKLFFSSAARGLACGNGFVMLDSAGAVSVAGHEARHRARASYPFEYDANAGAPLFEKLLADLFRDDDDAPQKIALIVEFFGGALFGLSTTYQKCLVLVGEGSNGKSTLLRILRSVFPPGSVVTSAPQTWGKPFETAQLVGRLLNCTGELPGSAMLDTEVFKGMITGDELKAERKYQDPFTFEPRAGHVFAANKLPGTNDHSEGFWRRFEVVRFNRSFEHDPSRDPEIAERIIATERKGILARLVSGASNLVKAGKYTEPTSNAMALRQWQTDSDPVRQFADAHFDESAVPTEVKGVALYATYSEWARKSGYKALANNNFATRMKSLGYESHKGRDGNVWTVPVRDGIRMFLGGLSATH